MDTHLASVATDTTDAAMVFNLNHLINPANGDGNNNENQEPNEDPASRLQALHSAHCVKLLGKGVIKVVHRVDDARENNNLDLSQCQLVQVPDAIYYMMRNTPLIGCNLSANVITKIPPKLPAKFAFIKSLDLSHNRMSSLPDEISDLSQLQTLNISHNSFISVPKCVFEAKKLTEVNANKNFVEEIDLTLVLSSPRLELLSLEENPLSRDCEQRIKSRQDNQRRITIKISHREMEEWEDLNI